MYTNITLHYGNIVIKFVQNEHEQSRVRMLDAIEACHLCLSSNRVSGEPFGAVSLRNSDRSILKNKENTQWYCSKHFIW